MEAGTTLELSHAGDQEQQVYRGRVIWNQAGRLAVAFPARDPVPAPSLGPGAPVDCLWQEAGQVRRATATVISREGMDPVVLVLSLRPEEQRPVQRRDFLRVRARRSVRYQPLAAEAADPGVRAVPVGIAATTDLSGGGIALRLLAELPRGSLLELVINLPGREVAATAEVVRSVPERDGYITAVRFIDIAEEDRANLIRYILREAWLNGAAPSQES